MNENLALTALSIDYFALSVLGYFSIEIASNYQSINAKLLPQKHCWQSFPICMRKSGGQLPNCCFSLIKLTVNNEYCFVNIYYLLSILTVLLINKVINKKQIHLKNLL